MTSIGTKIFTWRYGDLVGDDDAGNKYYREKKPHNAKREKRWVVYPSKVEASAVPPEWHAWLHHMTPEPLTDEAAKSKSWQKQHVANMTGTINAYRPKGHDFKGGKRAPATGDYEAWSPE